MKVLFFGDLASTGFGTVTSDAGRALLDRGVDLRFVSQNSFEQLPEPFLSRTLDVATFATGMEGVYDVRKAAMELLGGGSVEGINLANGEPWGDWRPDAQILLGDYYAIRDIVLRVGLDPFRAIPSFHYVPIEGHDLPPRWRLVWDVIKPIAMTRYGAAEIEKIMGEQPPMVYHGVDSEAFYPVSPRQPVRLAVDDKPTVLASKAACKVFFGLNPAMTLLLRTDRNMPRKGYPALFRALAPVMAQRPNVALAIHCRSLDQGGDLWDTVSKLDPAVQRRIIIPDFGPLPREALLALYNAADIYVSTSAEGFGLTIAEALACGVPAVALAYSAVPEVVGPAGELVPVSATFDNEYGHYWALPDEAEFGRRTAYLIDHPHARLALGAAGPKHVQQSFRWDAAAEQFHGIIEQALAKKDEVAA